MRTLVIVLSAIAVFACLVFVGYHVQKSAPAISQASPQTFQMAREVRARVLGQVAMKKITKNGIVPDPHPYPWADSFEFVSATEYPGGHACFIFRTRDGLGEAADSGLDLYLGTVQYGDQFQEGALFTCASAKGGKMVQLDPMAGKDYQMSEGDRELKWQGWH